MNITVVTQARIGSSRLPAKILQPVGDRSLLEIHLRRARQSQLANNFIVATTEEPGSEQIDAIAKACNWKVYKGQLTDVLDRFYQAIQTDKPDYVVRITSDCPLIDPVLIDTVIAKCVEGKYDYVSNAAFPSFPDGLDIEVFTYAALEESWNKALLSSEREHVTPFIIKNSTFHNKERFNSYCVQNKEDQSAYRITVDEEKDLSLIRQLVSQLGWERPWEDYIRYLDKNPSLAEVNSFIQRNEGYEKSIKNDKIMIRTVTDFKRSDIYRSKIHDLIPGGAHTYSKGDDQFPLLSPAAISHGKGGHVWDIDGNKFLDCSMGLTSVSLGHAYEPVLKRVRDELEKGVNFQRPSYIEMETAEAFLSVVGCHDMIKFAKNGSTVTTAAVKLARAYTGRKLVAFPFDHPFYSYDDWFIGKSACSLGVPEEFAALSVTFKADDLGSLKKLFEQYPGEIACVISEPEKNWGIPENYLQEAIDLVHANGALYIMDEMVSGYKTAFPGSIAKYNVKPDMATWGKGIANGFAFCALTGRKEIMELGGIRRKGAEKLFLISTTHGAETHAAAAALATIEEYRKHDVIGYLSGLGKKLNQLCQSIINANGLKKYIMLAPCDWQPAFVFKNESEEVSFSFRTLALQEMIKRGVLFQGIFSPCFSHTTEDIDYFAAAFEETAKVYQSALENGIDKYLIGEPTRPVFRKHI